MDNKIAEFRKRLGMSQEDLAQLVGVSRPYLSDIENRKYSPSGPLLLKIAKALGENVETVFSMK